MDARCWSEQVSGQAKALIKEYSVPKELTAPLLNAMIEKILIHEATTNEENERIQEIEIYYRFIGKVD